MTMPGVHSSPPGTQVDRIPEDDLGKWGESQIILEAASPEVARAISVFFDSAAGSQLLPRNGRIDSESDSGSGDSLFIPQGPTTKVKKADRRQRRPRNKQHALGVLTSVLQAQPARSAQRHPKYVKKKSKPCSKPIKKWHSRRYSFSFLPWIYQKGSTSRSKQKRKHKTRTSLRGYYNAKLHSSVIGGFFKCVKTHQLTAKHSESSSLPGRFIDEGVTLSPLSEEDEIDDCDIKVVKLNRFATSSTPRLKKTNPSQKVPQSHSIATNVKADTTRKTPQLFQGDDTQLREKKKRKKQEHGALELQLTGHLEESSTSHFDSASTRKRRRTSKMSTTEEMKDTGDSPKCTNGDQKVTECSSVQYVEVTPKKNKISETSTTDHADCGGVQNKHSASVDKTGTHGTVSFLFGDTVEKDYNAHRETTVSIPDKKKRRKCKIRTGLSTSGFDMDVVENINESQETVMAPHGIASTKKKKKQLWSFTGVLEESFVQEEFEAHNKYQSNSVSETMSLSETGLTKKKKKHKGKKDKQDSLSRESLSRPVTVFT